MKMLSNVLLFIFSTSLAWGLPASNKPATSTTKAAADNSKTPGTQAYKDCQNFDISNPNCCNTSKHSFAMTEYAKKNGMTTLICKDTAGQTISYKIAGDTTNFVNDDWNKTYNCAPGKTEALCTCEHLLEKPLYYKLNENKEYGVKYSGINKGVDVSKDQCTAVLNEAYKATRIYKCNVTIQSGLRCPYTDKKCPSDDDGSGKKCSKDCSGAGVKKGTYEIDKKEDMVTQCGCDEGFNLVKSEGGKSSTCEKKPEDKKPEEKKPEPVASRPPPPAEPEVTCKPNENGFPFTLTDGTTKQVCCEKSHQLSKDGGCICPVGQKEEKGVCSANCDKENFVKASAEFKVEDYIEVTDQNFVCAKEINAGPVCQNKRWCLRGSDNSPKEQKKIIKAGAFVPVPNKPCPDGSDWINNQCICRSFKNEGCACGAGTMILSLSASKAQVEASQTSNQKGMIKQQDDKIKALKDQLPAIEKKFKECTDKASASDQANIGICEIQRKKEKEELQTQIASEEKTMSDLKQQNFSGTSTDLKKGTGKKDADGKGKNANVTEILVCAKGCKEYKDVGGNVGTSGHEVSASSSGAQCIENGRVKTKSQEINEPLLRFAAATSLSVIQFMKAGLFDNEIDATKKRIELLKDMRASFKEDNGGFYQCAPGDRDNPDASPSCYCRNEDGSKNADRVNSDICNNYFAQLEFSFGPGGAYSDAVSYDYVSCFGYDGQQDPNCRCKYLTNSSGSNACFNIKSSNLQLPGFGSSSWASKYIDQANSLTTGKLSPTKINAADAKSNAMNMHRFLQNQLAGLNSEMKAQVKGAMDYNRKSQSSPEAMLASIANSSSGSSSGSSGGSGVLGAAQGSMMNSMPDSAKEKMAGILPASYTVGKGKGKMASVKKQSDDGNWGFGSGASEAGGVKVQEVMDKNFNYKENDITKNPGTDIFKIISNRYQRSAMRRLFDDENNTQSEAASGSDINSN